MTLADLLVELSKLDRIDKLRVIQHLSQELEDELDTGPFTPNRVYEVWSPQDEGNAVATLHKLLQERKQAWQNLASMAQQLQGSLTPEEIEAELAAAKAERIARDQR